MTKKKPNDADEPRFEVKKRKPKEKPDYFQNIPSFAHPLAEIFKKSPENLETQKEIIGTPNLLQPETQILPFVNPNKENLETQNNELGIPNIENLETQTLLVGNPNAENLDAMQPKTDIWKPKKKADLDAKQPKIKDLETQTSEKPAAGKHLKKYEKARSTEPLHARVEKSIAQRIRHFLVDSKFTLKEFVEMSAIKFMDEFGNPKEINLDANQPYDDRQLKIYRTKPTIINLYLGFSKNLRWKMSDDVKASAYNEIDIKIIELGILQTLGNKTSGGKINSFAYFIPEIENWIEAQASEEMMEQLLAMYRKKQFIQLPK